MFADRARPVLKVAACAGPIVFGQPFWLCPLANFDGERTTSCVWSEPWLEIPACLRRCLFGEDLMSLVPFLDVTQATSSRPLKPEAQPFLRGLASTLDVGPALRGPPMLPPNRTADELARATWDDVGADIGWALWQMRR
jgi:hypothetical protein